MKAIALTVALFAVCMCAYVEPTKAGVYLPEVICGLDPRVTAETLTSYKNGTYLKQIGRWLWGTACGRSRGVFTLTNLPQYAGHTYSCANWPEDWGIKHIGDWFKTPDVYEQHLIYLDWYIQGNYNTTAVHAPGTCDFANFALTKCGAAREAPHKTAPWADKLNGKPFRGVNTGGVFVLEPWITPNFTKWTFEMADQYVYSQNNPAGSPGYKILVDHWDNWYTDADFKAMKSMGLNAIRVPVGWWYWAKDAGIDPSPYTVPTQEINDPAHPITKFIRMAKANDLWVILDLHAAPGSQNGLDNSGQRSYDPNPARWGYKWFYDPEMQDQTVKVLVEMLEYIFFLESQDIDNVIALELLNEPWVYNDMSIVRDFYRKAIVALRKAEPEGRNFPIVIHDAFRHAEWDWLLADWPFENVVMDTHIYHAFNPDDIASSNPTCDKNKMIVAENIACGYGSMLRFKTCISLPTFVGEWSLAVDDCMGVLRGAESSVQFQDFGQCKNLKQRVGDPWWIQHYRNFAIKQMAMAERELGWFFWTWKTGPGSDLDPSVAYWSYSHAVKAGIIPHSFNETMVKTACYEFEDTDPFVC